MSKKRKWTGAADEHALTLMIAQADDAIKAAQSRRAAAGRQLALIKAKRARQIAGDSLEANSTSSPVAADSKVAAGKEVAHWVLLR